MPQFDVLAYSAEYIWLVIVLAVLYRYNIVKVLPQISRVLKVRNMLEKGIEDSVVNTVKSGGESMLRVPSIAGSISVKNKDKEYIRKYEQAVIKAVVRKRKYSV